MDDNKIIELYFARDEVAIAQTAQRYGKLCHRVAMNILDQNEDAEECVNDTYLQAWNTIPPERPAQLSAYLCRITRNLAIDRFRTDRRHKRGAGQAALAVEELSEVLSQDGTSELDRIALRDAISGFLRGERETERNIFIKRYWFVRPIADIADEYGMSESRVKMILLRARRRLHEYLRKEGFES